jgi:hypothetical protein
MSRERLHVTDAINYEEENVLGEDAPSGYEMFLHKRDNCEKVVLST